MSAENLKPEMIKNDAIKLLKESTKRLLASEILEVKLIAINVAARLSKGTITYEIPSSELPCPSLTAFDLTFQDPGTEPVLRPVLVINPTAILTASDAQRDADLLRTFAVADQYPRDYADSYSQIYDRALDTQQRWLEANKIQDKLLFDPRIQDRETIKKKLLGEKRYVCDASIRDWDKACDSPLTKAYLPKGETIDEIRRNTQLFIVRRQAYTPTIYSRLRSEYRNFSTMSHRFRARINGSAYLAITLDSRDRARKAICN